MVAFAKDFFDDTGDVLAAVADEFIRKGINAWTPDNIRRTTDRIVEGAYKDLTEGILKYAKDNHVACGLITIIDGIKCGYHHITNAWECLEK